ncbi:MAG: GTPase Era [Parcubacteria group bacterium ADurb.Bin192]|nr:MAG: GTPase Era [Parcubacteria group bacterium ADurb.Bin192]
MKSGFVMLAGRSNVGKSTLLNAIIGNKVAIVTPKPQTTRLPIRGILHDERGQIVFVDTPGIFLGKKDALSLRLNKSILETLEGIDIIVYVTDPTRRPGPEEEHMQRLLNSVNKPLILAINKIDITDAKANQVYENINIGQLATFKISAAKHTNLNRLVDALFELLPEGEKFYPDLQITDLGHQQWIEEVIREKIFLNLEQELPYSVDVAVLDIKFRANGGRYIEAEILTTNDRYKRMIIGSGAANLKQIGMAARKELEGALNTNVHLDLQVRVDAKWQDSFGRR